MLVIWRVSTPCTMHNAVAVYLELNACSDNKHVHAEACSALLLHTNALAIPGRSTARAGGWSAPDTGVPNSAAPCCGASFSRQPCFEGELFIDFQQHQEPRWPAGSTERARTARRLGVVWRMRMVLHLFRVHEDPYTAADLVQRSAGHRLLSSFHQTICHGMKCSVLITHSENPEAASSGIHSAGRGRAAPGALFRTYQPVRMRSTPAAEAAGALVAAALTRRLPPPHAAPASGRASRQPGCRSRCAPASS